MNWISFMAGAAAGACFALVAAFVAVLWLLGAAVQPPKAATWCAVHGRMLHPGSCPYCEAREAELEGKR
jgi:hypothetical protein